MSLAEVVMIVGLLPLWSTPASQVRMSAFFSTLCVSEGRSPFPVRLCVSRVWYTKDKEKSRGQETRLSPQAELSGEDQTRHCEIVLAFLYEDAGF